MSTFLNPVRGRTLLPTKALPRPRLTIVPKVAARAPRIPFALLVVSVLAAGLVGLLLLNTALQRGAYTVTALQQTSADLSLRQQNLQTEVAALEAPQRISQRAVRLGMVASDSPAFLSLKTGQVIGVPKAGTRAQRPAIALTGGGQGAPAASVTEPGVRTSGKVGPGLADQVPSLKSDVITVPRAKQNRKPTDTAGTSADPAQPRDRKNTSNTGQSQPQQQHR